MFKINEALEFSLILLFITARTGTAAWQYKDCDDVTGGDFKVVPIVTKTDAAGTVLKSMMEPLKMAFYQDENGNVNIYFIQRRGQIIYYSAKDKTVTDVGKIDAGPVAWSSIADEDGLTGIALDPGFKSNKFLYLYYSKGANFQVSRFQLDNSNKLINASEKSILQIPCGRGRWHTSGALGFDDYGDLWIHTGDNESAEMGPANTADLRGKVLRIHPKADGTYEIPKGNLWEFAADKFDKGGQADIAKKYRDPNLVKHEIYAMGMRNPYTMGLDPVRRWDAYGDCGPDHCAGDCNSEEHSVMTEPGFFGWPYWTGNNYVQPSTPTGYDEKNESWWGNKDPLMPANLNGSAKGANELLPHSPAQNFYHKSCAMTGPIARYIPGSKAPYKLPPHFNHIWFVADFNSFWVDAIQLSEDGKKTLKKERMWEKSNLASKWGKMLDFQQGPDGALYILGYTCSAWRVANKCTGIWRIEYTGNCTPSNFKMEKVGCTDKNFKEFDSSATHNNPRLCKMPALGIKIKGAKGGLLIDNLEIAIDAPGKHTVRVFGVAGKPVFKITGNGKTRHPMPKFKKPGIYFIRVETGQGVYTKSFMNF